MALILYSHPLASFCHKVLIALYENETPFEAHLVDFSNAEESRRFTELWPVGRMPVLRDDFRDRTIPETSIIIEYLEQYYPGARPLLPQGPDGEKARLEARLWDRFYDLYVQEPMQKIVGDRMRPEDGRDPLGVAEARETLLTAYGVIERQLTNKTWAIGDEFGIADCAAAPALFYAGIVEPFAPVFQKTSEYFERLLSRPSFKRVLIEANPYFQYFPYKDDVPSRFLHMRHPDHMK